MRAIAAILTLLAAACPVLAVDISAPGVTVLAGDVGILQADLQCDDAVGVHLQSGATLDLNGHVLDGCSVSVATPTQTIPQRISVRGPGEIRNAVYGVHLRTGVLRIRDVVIDDCRSGILGSGDFGDGPSTVKATNVTVTGSEFAGIQATKVKARNVTTSDNGLVGTFPGGGIVGWGGVSGKEVTASNNGGEGVFSLGRTKLKDSTVTGNAYSGVYGVKVTVVGSTVTGNATSNPGGDVVSGYAPVVKTTTCGTSLHSDGLTTWGVCAGD